MAVLAAAPGATAHGQGLAIRCDYRQRIECTARARDGASLSTIQVCDATACTPIAVQALAGGAFVNIAQDGGAHFVKVAIQDIRGAGRGSAAVTKGAFVEVAAQLLSTVTHVGSCPALVASASTP